MYRWQQFRPVIDSITIGPQGLLLFIGTLPLLDPLYEDTSAKGGIQLNISLSTLAISSGTSMSPTSTSVAPSTTCAVSWTATAGTLSTGTCASR